MKVKLFKQAWFWTMNSFIILLVILIYLVHDNFILEATDLIAFIGSGGTIAAIVVAISIYKKGVKNDRVRATVTAFPQLRKENNGLILELNELENESDKERRLKSYMAQMEHFAVGINMKAYDIKVVNRMSGNLLVHQYSRKIKEFIKHRNVDCESRKYCEYIKMMKKLYKLRGLKWED